ncbi:FxSxx-COOH cyclophane-containing RiPP peptide [Streptomyces sp. NPDC058398]|uniref:FxSxx-COOH cyclophane-containing RiPP peptide n=1 Tax=Streptomyces sp. NPDC058398 TaxID=3346479 RepID=UPI00365E53DD
MGARDDVADGAQDREAAGDRPPWSVPSPTPGPARPAAPEAAWDDPTDTTGAPAVAGLAGTPAVADPTETPDLADLADLAGPAGTADLAGPAGAPDSADLAVLDLLDLDLAELRTIQHPVLTEVLADLRARSGEPSEILWGFNNAF